MRWRKTGSATARMSSTETLGRLRPFAGKRLTILTNGGGIGVLALDRLADFGGTPAELSAATLARLDAGDELEGVREGFAGGVTHDQSSRALAGP